MVTRVLLIVITFFFAFGLGTFLCYAIDGKFSKENISLSSIQNLTKERYERNIEETITAISQLIQYTAERGRDNVIILPHILKKFGKEDREMILNYFKNKGFKIEEDKQFYNILW